MSEERLQRGAPGHTGLLPGLALEVSQAPLAARSALQRLVDWMAPLALEIEETSTVELVLAEVLNNILEHAYPEGQTSGLIRLNAEHHIDGLHFWLCDWGRPMPKGVTPLGELAPRHNDLMDLPEGGFGWFLIKDLAKDVTYTREGGENRLSLRIAVAVQPGC